jgi:uroporphyrinogen decarboxylase
MDPLVLYGSKERTITEVRRVLSAFGSRKGYVFNLGHGIHPQSSLENVEAMLQEVRMFQPA